MLLLSSSGLFCIFSGTVFSVNREIPRKYARSVLVRGEYIPVPAKRPLQFL
jgi:hypothetical protein